VTSYNPISEQLGVIGETESQRHPASEFPAFRRRKGLTPYGTTVHNEGRRWRAIRPVSPQRAQALHDEDNGKGVPGAMAEKLRKLLFALETADSLDQVGRFPGWKLHPLKGDLKGFWSLTVSGNWRLIFTYDEKTNTAHDIDLIDYH
jgi:toxin HigB-1